MNTIRTGIFLSPARIPVTLALMLMGFFPASVSGSWEISGDGEYFSFQAERANAAEIIQHLEEMTGISLSVQKLPATPVTAKFFNVTLDELLYRMDLEYVLEYTRSPDSDVYRLSGGWINYEDPGERLYTDFSEINPGHDPGKVLTDFGYGETPVIPPAIKERLKMPGGIRDGKSAYKAAYPLSPRVDGRINNWPDGIPWQNVGSDASIGVQAPTNNADASFAMAGIADATNMYLALAIRDDMKAVTNASRMPLQEDDAIELQLLMPNASDNVSVTVNRHHVYRRSASGDEPPRPAARQYVSYHNGVRAVIIDDDDGWNIEMSVPLDALDDFARAGGTMGFDILLRDVDANDTVNSVLSWSQNARLNATGSSGSDSSLGTVEFIDIRK